MASHGRSAGASGSSQSPNCIDSGRGVHRAPPARSSESTQRACCRLAAQDRADRRTPRRPPRAPSWPRRPSRPARSAARPASTTSGTTDGTPSTSSWSSARSRSQLAQNRSTSNSVDAVGRERLGVAGPAEPLVALRAVGRDRHEVVALRPDDVLVEPVQAGRPSRRTCLARGVSLLMATNVGAQHLGIGVDLRVPEPMERERRLELDRAVVGERCRCRSPSPTEGTGCGANRRARGPRRAGR